METSSSPKLPPMNLQERCRRAEMIAERMAAAISDYYGDEKEWRAGMRAALDAWHQHRADLDTLAQAQQEGA